MSRSLILASASLLLLGGVAQAQTAPAVASAPAPAPAAAPAVASPIVIYNVEQLIAQSAAGTDMRTKLTAIGDQIRRELEPDQKQLQTELAAIRATSVADAQTPAAQQRQESFQRLYGQFQQKQERLSAVMELTQRNALNAFSQALAPVLRASMLSRNGLVAMQSQSVDAYVPGIEITSDLVARLNATTKTINVTRATLPTQQGGPAAAAGTPTPVPAAAGTTPRQPPRPTPVPR